MLSSFEVCLSVWTYGNDIGIGCGKFAEKAYGMLYGYDDRETCQK